MRDETCPNRTAEHRAQTAYGRMSHFDRFTTALLLPAQNYSFVRTWLLVGERSAPGLRLLSRPRIGRGFGRSAPGLRVEPAANSVVVGRTIFGLSVSPPGVFLPVGFLPV